MPFGNSLHEEQFAGHGIGTCEEEQRSNVRQEKEAK